MTGPTPAKAATGAQQQETFQTMSDDAVDTRRRRFLTGTTVVIGGIGAAFTAVPFVSSFQPSAKAKAIGAPVEVDISKLEPGQRVIQKWRGKPVWVVRRTPEMLENLKSFDASVLRDPKSEKSEQPEYARNDWRSDKPEFLVLVGICTHLGCSPVFSPKSAHLKWVPPGKAGFSARATGRSSIWQAACSPACRRRPTWWCPRTASSPTPS